MKYIVKSNNGHRYANSHVVIYENGEVVMFSYTTAVIRIDSDGWLSVRAFTAGQPLSILVGSCGNGA